MDPLEYRAHTARHGRSTYVLAVAGELDLYVRPELEKELQAIVARGGRNLIVDLTAAEFLDSSIVGLLLHYLRELRSHGGDLVLVSDDRRILRPFGILGFDRVFTIRPRLDDALAELPLDGRVMQPC
jgi:anti-sigma B factor antagonist